MQNIKYLSHSNFSINKSFTAFVLMILISLAGTIRGFSQAPIGDRQIVSSIETAIADDQLIDPDALKISSLNGIVTMESWTSNLLVKDRAVKIATSIKGVRSIIDRMSVRPAFVRDDVIQQNVKNALAYDPATESYEVNVTSDNYIVTLTGTVDSWQEKQLAAEVAKGIKGVQKIENNIDVQFNGNRDDSEIEMEIKRRMQSSIWVDAEAFSVKVNNHVVTISGYVGDLPEKNRAYTMAWVPGVKNVNDENLIVASVLDDDMQKKNRFMTVTDEQIKSTIEDAMMYDPRVASYQPNIEVENKVVSLTGKVKDFLAKRAAGENAKNTYGVKTVKNDLLVQPVFSPADEIIEEHVEEALLWDPVVEKYQISVDVVNGEVLLNGIVNNAFEKYRAVRVAGGIAGVVGVNNAITIQSPTAVY